MDETHAELLMRVDGMTCDGCAAAVTRTVRRIDPGEPRFRWTARPGASRSARTRRPSSSRTL